jgi:hypothetical protein
MDWTTAQTIDCCASRWWVARTWVCAWMRAWWLLGFLKFGLSWVWFWGVDNVEGVMW